jgi:hypothetical protein
MMSDVLDSALVHTNEWQSIDTTGSKVHGTHELEDVTLRWDQLPDDLDTIVPAIDHSWADDHFIERVSGTPHNPPPSHLSWPYAVRGNTDHTAQGAFDHTYPERFWPKFANEGQTRPNGRQVFVPHNGIRFEYGDLADVVSLLSRSPLTRQAFLPVWFPEDTGANQGQRVPCTIGYHFMQRRGKLSCRYYIRSCDVYRHLSNDVYFAAMLTKWICSQIRYNTDSKIRFHPGSMTMHISSMHAFVGDVPKIKARLEVLGDVDV